MLSERNIDVSSFPYEWLCVMPLLHWKRNPACGWSKSGRWPVEILTSFGRNLLASPADGKARRTFVLRALFTLAAIYSRGTCRPTTIDVLMFHFRVRNGTGWGHQAMTTRLLPYFVLPTLYFVLQFVWSSSALAGCCAVCWLPCWQQADIRVACFLRFLQLTHSLYT